MLNKYSRHLIALCSLYSVTAHAAPFGMEMGMSLEQIDITKSYRQISPGNYIITSPPKPDNFFARYAIQVAPKAGLCWLKALSKNIPTDLNGNQLKAQFNLMKNQLENKFGDSKSSDFLMAGSTLHSANDWLTGLNKQERLLFAIYEKQDGGDLSTQIKTITLAAVGRGENKGGIALEYVFANIDECDREIASQIK